MMNYWLFKSEPTCYSIDDLKRDQVEPWDGIRNYQARNFLRDICQIGDPILYYHSSCAVPGVVGLAEIASEAYPDDTAWDPNSDHPDPKSTPENPRWMMRDVKFVEKFSEVLPLSLLKEIPELQDMQLLKKGNRLSLFPVTKAEYDKIIELARSKSN